MSHDLELIQEPLHEPSRTSRPVDPLSSFERPSERGMSNLALLYSGRRIENLTIPRLGAKP